MTLEEEFHNAMLGVYEKAKLECNYNATRFLQMVNEMGGLDAAKRLLVDHQWWTSGLAKLWELERLDISMENLVIQEKWSPLFTEEEVREATERLIALEFIHQ